MIKLSDDKISMYSKKIKDILMGLSSHDPAMFPEERNKAIIKPTKEEPGSDDLVRFQYRMIPKAHLSAIRKLQQIFGPCFMLSSRPILKDS